MSSGNMVKHIQTRETAEDFTDAHPELFEDFTGMSREACVAEVDRRRALGLDTAPVETWLLAKFEAPPITGVFQ